MKKDELEAFIKPNPDAYKKYRKTKRHKMYMTIFHKLKIVWKALSNIILWICAVGGFVLSLIQFFQDS